MTKAIDKKVKKVRTLPQLMVKAGVKATQKPLLDSYRRDAGSDLRMSGVPGNWRFKVTTSVRGTGLNGPVRGRARMRPAGPASMLNAGTRPRPQGGGRHPGTRGKRTFERALPDALRLARREVKRIFHAEMG